MLGGRDESKNLRWRKHHPISWGEVRLSTYFGALKARYQRWSLWLELLQMTGILRIVAPFVTPWLRATVYSGDRIAYACCGDLDVSLKAVYATLVGKSSPLSCDRGDSPLRH